MRQDRSTRLTQRKRLRARSGHSQRATAKPTAGVDKATTKKGARDGKRKRLRQGLQVRNKREKGDRHLKGKDQAEREGPSQTRSRMEDHSQRTGSHRALRELSGRGRSLTQRRRVQAQNNLLTGGRAKKVDLEADHGQGSTMEITTNLPRPAASVRTIR